MISRLAKCLTIPLLALFLAAAVETDDDAVGKVSRIQGTAFAMQDAVPRRLAVGSTIFVNDVISTGLKSRLEITMIDDGSFTLGARAVFVVLEYVAKVGQENAATRLLSGAVTVVAGLIAGAEAGRFRLESETATIGIRGTKFWGGMIDGVFQVAYFEGKAITVENAAGRVVLRRPGFGTRVEGAGVAPAPPKKWGADKIRRAVAMTAFSPTAR